MLLFSFWMPVSRYYINGKENDISPNLVRRGGGGGGVGVWLIIVDGDILFATPQQTHWPNIVLKC